MGQRFLYLLLLALCKVLFRVEIRGQHHLASAGPRVVIALNHVSFADPLVARLLFGRQTAHYIIDPTMAGLWWVKPVLRFARTYAAEPARPFALRAAIRAARQGVPIIIFPEGRLTMTGNLMKLYGGVTFVARHADAVVIPGHITGLGATPLTRIAVDKVRRRWLPKVTLTLGAPLTPDTGLLQAALRGLAADEFSHTSITEALAHATRTHGHGTTVLQSHPVSAGWTYRRLLQCRNAFRDQLDRVQPHEGTVAMCVPRSCNDVALFLALMCGPQHVVLVDPTLDVAALSRLHRLARVSIFAALQKDTRHIVLPPEIKRVVLKEGIRSGPLHLTVQRQYAQHCPTVRFYNINTARSGDTIAWSQAELIAAAMRLAVRCDLTRADRVFAAGPFYDENELVAGLIWPLLRGARLVLPDRRTGLQVLVDDLYIANVSVLTGHAAFLTRLAVAAAPEDFYALRYVLLTTTNQAPECEEIFGTKFGVPVRGAVGATIHPDQYSISDLLYTA